MAVNTPQSRSSTTGRFGGSVFESATGFLQGLKSPKQQQRGGTPTPTSPAGAMAAGATEDQAKMFGAGAQQQASLSRAMQDVSASKAAPPPQALQAATQQAQALQSLGSLGSRVQQLIESRAANVAQATPQMTVNEEALSGLFQEPTAEARTTKTTAAKAALEAWIAAPSQTTLDAFLEVTGLSAEAGAAGGLDQYLITPEQALKTSIEGAGLTQDVKLGDLDLAAAGLDPAATAASLGITPEQLSAMTLPELQAAVEQTQSSSFSRVADLEAEARGASDARKAEIDQELQALRGYGVADIERQVASIAQDIQAAQTITWMGRQVALEDLLSNEQITQDILGALTNPAALKDLKDNPNTAALGTWIETNKTALATLAKDLTTQAGEIQAATSQAKQLVSSTFGGDDVFKALAEAAGKSYGANLTAAELADIQTSLANTPLAAALQEDPAVRQALTADPTIIAQIKDMLPANATADDVKRFFAGLGEVQSDAGLKEILGVTGDLKFLTPAQQEQLARIKASPVWADPTMQTWLKSDIGRNKRWLEATPAQIKAAQAAAKTLQDSAALATLVGFNPGDMLADAGIAMKAEQVRRKFPEMATALDQPGVKALAQKNPQALKNLGSWLFSRKAKPQDVSDLLTIYNKAGLSEGLGLALGDALEDMKPTRARMDLLRKRTQAWEAIPQEVTGDQEFIALLRKPEGGGQAPIQGALDLAVFKDPAAWKRLKPELTALPKARAALASAKTPQAKLDAAVEGLFGGEVDIEDLGRLAGRVTNALKEGKFSSDKVKRQYQGIKDTLVEMFGFMPSMSDFGLTLNAAGKFVAGAMSDKMGKVLNTLTDRVNISPAKLIDSLRTGGEAELADDRKLFDGVKEFLAPNGFKSLPEPYTYVAKLPEKPAAITPQSTPKQVTADAAWMKKFNRDPLNTILDLPKDLAVATVQHLESTGQLEKGASQPIKDALIKTAPSEAIPDEWKLRKPEDIINKPSSLLPGGISTGGLNTGGTLWRS